MIPAKQKRFCREYLIDHNGTKAAIRAGYSKQTAKQQASMLLAKPAVKSFMATITAKMDTDLTVTAERVIAEIAKISFADPGGYFITDGKNPRMKRMDELTADQRAAVQEFDFATKKLKLYDKLNGLEKLGKHLKLFTELHEMQHTFTVMPTVKRGGRTLEFNVGQPKAEK